MLNFFTIFFSASIYNDHMIFVLQFVNVLYHFNWYVEIESTMDFPGGSDDK